MRLLLPALLLVPLTAAASPLARYARAMARGDWGAAYDVLADEDRSVLTRDDFEARYRRLARIPWVGAVLRSARVQGGRLTAADWSYARFARRGLLANAELLAALPRRTYLPDARERDGRLRIDLAGVSQARNGSATVVETSADWFGLYVTIFSRCPPAARHLLVEVSSDGVRGDLAIDCGATGAVEVPVVVEVEPRRWKVLVLSANVVGIVPRDPADPFRAPDPEQVGHPAYPVEP